MPKATVNEDQLPATGEYKIGGSWQVFPVEPETIAQSMGQGAHS
jgi:hypothetical protein